jgi:hypothetical protein
MDRKNILFLIKFGAILISVIAPVIVLYFKERGIKGRRKKKEEDM